MKTQGSLLSLPSGSHPEQTVATLWLEFTWLEVTVEGTARREFKILK